MNSFLIKNNNNIVGVFNDLELSLNYVYSLINSNLIKKTSNVVIYEYKINKKGRLAGLSQSSQSSTMTLFFFVVRFIFYFLSFVLFFICRSVTTITITIITITITI